MAGIGFELKRLFAKKGLFASARAYGYASAICAGPMLLGIALLLGVMILCGVFGIDKDQQNLLISLVTYTLLASLLVSSLFSMVVTRYVSDMLYEGKMTAVMPAFWGSNAVMLVLGCALYGIFLAFSGVTLMQKVLCLTFFAELIVVWNAMTYLTAIKDYGGVLRTFVLAVAVAAATALLLLSAGQLTVDALLAAVCAGYGIMMCMDVVLLQRYFPRGDKGAFRFLQWMDRYKTLAFTGLFINVGLFAHLVIMWFGPVGQQIQGLFYGAPVHDVPAMLAFMTVLVTTVNFVVSVEVTFYPHYRSYCAAYTENGNIHDIMQAQTNMLEVLRVQLFYTAVKQFCTTVLVIALSRLVFSILPLGFDDLMYGYFRTLAVGYGMYAIGNAVLLLLMYFTDYTGAVMTAALFAVLSVVLTLLSLQLPIVYLGVGFLAASAVFYAAAVWRMKWFTKRLHYYMLGRQPMVIRENDGLFTKLETWLEVKTAGK